MARTISRRIISFTHANSARSKAEVSYLRATCPLTAILSRVACSPFASFCASSLAQKPSGRYTGVRTATRKYIKFENGQEKLYSLAADPHESESRAGEDSYAHDLAHLRSLNERLKSCAGQVCWVP